MRPLLKTIMTSFVLTLIGGNLLLAEGHQTDASISISPSAEKPPGPQTTCPVMGGAIGPIDKALYVDVKGKRIYICCAACEGAIRTNPDMYIKKIENRGETVADTPTPVNIPPATNEKTRP